MTDMQAFGEMIETWQEMFGLSDEEKDFLKQQEDAGCACLFLECLFCGITVPQMKEMEAHALNSDQIREKRRQILSDRFRRRDQLASEILTMKQQMEKTIEDTETVRHYYEEKLEASWEAERQALKEVIKAREESILEYRQRLKEMDLARHQKPSGAPAQKRRRAFFGRIREGDSLPAEGAVKDTDEFRKQRDFEAAQFRDNILRSPDYTKEQKEFLLSCFREGISYWRLLDVAYPDLDVAFMKAVLDRKKERY